MADVVNQHRAGAALTTIAADFGSRHAELVAQRVGQRLLWQDIDPAGPAIDVKGNQAFDRTPAFVPGAGGANTCMGSGRDT